MKIRINNKIIKIATTINFSISDKSPDKNQLDFILNITYTKDKNNKIYFIIIEIDNKEQNYYDIVELLTIRLEKRYIMAERKSYIEFFRNAVSEVFYNKTQKSISEKDKNEMVKSICKIVDDEIK